jgi:elongation factor G
VLEPVMGVKVTVPEENAAAVRDGIQSRRGRVTGTGHRGGSLVIYAIVPLSEMLGYAKRMSANTGVPVECSMRFIHYAEVPPRGESGSDEAGVTANLPRSPKPRHRSAAADPEAD